MTFGTYVCIIYNDIDPGDGNDGSNSRHGIRDYTLIGQTITDTL